MSLRPPATTHGTAARTRPTCRFQQTHRNGWATEQPCSHLPAPWQDLQRAAPEAGMSSILHSVAPHVSTLAATMPGKTGSNWSSGA
jgi:hypothetical protein